MGALRHVGFSARDLRLVSICNSVISEGVFYVEASRVCYANQALANILGYRSEDELLNLDPSALFDEKDFYHTKRNEADLNGNSGASVVKCLRKDERSFWASVHIVKMADEDGTFYAVILSDISERKIVENQLRENNENLQKVNAQLDRFLYSASHDIRQPLTSMMGLIRLMRMEKFRDQWDAYVDKLDKSVTRLDEFLSEVMEFSRNTHERIESQRIDFNVMLERVIRQYAKHPHFESITFNIVVEKILSFYSDARRIEIALDHVIKNSILYFDPSKVHSFIDIKVTETAEEVNIEVIDNGIGIAKGHIDKVFEMFYRASEKSRGSGLGLYVVKETLLTLGGEITIDSEVCFGTIVRMKIPNHSKGKLISKKLKLIRGKERP